MLPLALGPYSSNRGIGSKGDHNHPPSYFPASASLPSAPNMILTGLRPLEMWEVLGGITPAQSPVQPGTGANCGFKSHLCHLLSVGLPRNYHWKLPTFSLLYH